MAKGVTDNDKGFAALRRLLAMEVSAAAVKVGVLQSAGEHQDEHGEAVTIAQVAAWNEYGTEDGHVPSRPAFRLAADDNRANIATAQERMIGQVLEGKIDINTALQRVGMLVQGYVRRSIIDLADPPNAESTIKAKGSSNPLIDSGQLAQSITYEVVKRSQLEDSGIQVGGEP
jgi:hypothetical protein